MSNPVEKYNLNNPGFLKIDLLTKGVIVGDSAKPTDEIIRINSVAKKLGIIPEVDLVLPGDILVNVALKSQNNESPYVLEKDGSSFVIATNSSKVDVSVLSPPSFYDKKSDSNISLANIGRLYGEYLLITPTMACDFLSQKMGCFYCDVANRIDKKRTVEEVIQTISEASKDGAVKVVCLNTGYLSTPDGGVAVLEPYIKEIKKRFNVLIAIQAQPPLEDEWIDYTYALGVDSLAYNLEVYDPQIFAEIAPGKKKLIGRERYIESLKRAAQVFPRGSVVSNLIIGLEPVESTIKGINALTSIGVIPTLPIAREAGVNTPENWHNVEIEDIAKIFLHLNQTLKKHKLSDSWVSHSNIAMNAIDGRFFGGDAQYRGKLDNLFRSKRGAKLARSLSRLRRSLRVKKITE